MKFWRRPLRAMTGALTAAGFRLTVIDEPRPDPSARDAFPEEFDDASTKLSWLVLVAETPAPPRN